MSRSRRRRRRWLVVIGLAVLLLLGTGFAVLRVKFEGPDLGDKLASILNKRMRGRIEIGSIEWPASALKKVVTGGWVPLRLTNVKVWDDCALSAGATSADPDELRIEDPNKDCTDDDKPDSDPKSKRKPRRLLLDAPDLTVEIDIHAALFGNHDLVFRKLWIHGGEALIEQTAEPYPLHAYNRTIVSLITAFYPRMKAGFRAGIYADAPPPIFDIRDIHIEHLNVTIHVSPYTNNDGTVGFGLAARIVGVDIDPDPKAPKNDAYFYMDPTDPIVTKFYVRLALRGQHGSLRLLDEGPRAAFHIPGSQGLGDEWGKGRTAKYEIELSEIAINRLAQLPTEWPRKDYIANSLELDGSAHTVACKTEHGPASANDGAELRFTGEILNYWDSLYDGQWNLKLDVKNFGPTLRSCIKSTMGGADLGGTIAIQGPFVALPKVILDLHGLDFDLPLSAKEEPVRLTLAEVHGEIDLVNETGYIDKTKALVRGGTGEVMISATFGLKPVILHADIDITKPIDVGRFLPAKVASAVGSYVAGKLTINGDIEYGFELKDFDLGLGTLRERALRLYSGRIFAKNVFDTIAIEKVKFEAGKSRATIDGGIEYTNNDHYEYRNLKIDGDYQDLDVWLRRFGLPPIIKSADGGTITLNGPITTPTINAKTTLAGIPCIGTMQIVNSQLKDNVFDIQVATNGLGGSLTGKGRLLLAPNSAPFIDSFEVNGQNLEAGRLCGLQGAAKGTIATATVQLSKASIDQKRSVMDWMKYAKIMANAPHLQLYGEDYSSFALCLNRKDDAACRPDLQRARLDADDLLQCEVAKGGGFCAVATAVRDLGGQLDATIASIPAPKVARGKPTTPAKLGGTIALDNVPLAVVEKLVGASTLGGVISAAFHLQGTPDAPQADGNIDILRSWALGAFIGDLHPRVDPIMIGKVPGLLIRGSGMSGNLEISAMIGTRAPYPVKLEIKTHRLELDSFVDLSKKLGLSEPVQAWMTAVISVSTELAPAGGKPAQPEAWVEIQELEAFVDHRAKDGRLTPLRFELVAPNEAGKNAMSLHVTPTTVELSCRDATAPGGRVPCPARLDTPAGIVSLEGNASQSQMALNAHGTLDMKRLGPLVETQVDSITGTIDLDAKISGTIDKPHYEVSLGEFKNLSVRPAGGDTELQIQTGQVKLANGSLGFNNVTLNVKDEHRDEQGKLVIRGGISLDGLTPLKWGVLIGGPETEEGKPAEPGRIAGKMLLVIAPSAFSQASGLARIDGDITLSGTGELPLVNGTLTFDPDPSQKVKAPFAFVPRGVRREIAMLGGSIEISTRAVGNQRTYTLSAEDNPITTSIDGEGKLTHIHGNVVLTNGVPDHATIELDAESIPFRTTDGALDLVVSAKDVSLVLPSAKAAWIATGNISIISGEYKRNFELTEVLKPAPASTAPAKPFWDEYPSIGNAQLGLTLDIGKFSVENNIASIDLAGSQIFITGSPRDPRLSGNIRVQRGEFRIPGTRAKFTRTTGSIDFTQIQKASNPRLDVTTEAPDYIDLSGQPHTITLTIFGTLEEPRWDLKTSTGLDRSQTLALLLLGRSPEQLRRSLGDQALGSNPTLVDPTTNPSTGFGDQIVKDLAGDWVSGLLGGSLTKLTGLDVLRFQVGFGSVGIHAEKKVAENIKLIGDGEQTSRGQTLNARIEIRTPYHAPWKVIAKDRFTLQGAYLDKNYYDPAELDIRDFQGKLVYRLFIP